VNPERTPTIVSLCDLHQLHNNFLPSHALWSHRAYFPANKTYVLWEEGERERERKSTRKLTRVWEEIRVPCVAPQWVLLKETVVAKHCRIQKLVDGCSLSDYTPELLPWIKGFFLTLEFFPLCFSCGLCLWNEKGRFAVSIPQRKMEVCIFLSQDYSILMWIPCAAYVFCSVCSVFTLCVWYIHSRKVKFLGTYVICRLKCNVNILQLIFWSCLCCTWQNLLLSKHEFGVIILNTQEISICCTWQKLLLPVLQDTHSWWSLEGWSHSGVETPSIYLSTEALVEWCWSLKS
jgi:hypothetical protein